MLADQITLPVDELNDDTLVNYVFSRFSDTLNNSTYIGAEHASDARDTLKFYRTFSKANGNFRGVKKSAFKFSWDQQVTGVDGVSVITAPLISDVAFSIPEGTTDANVLIMRQRIIALLDHALMDSLNITQMV
jgi:hypothetical protein